MQFVKCVLVLCTAFQLIHVVWTGHHLSPSDYDEIDDDDHMLPPPMPPHHHFHGDPDIRAFERQMLRDMADDEPEFFNEKETRIRNALFHSTQDVRSQRTLTEMLPILRSLSAAQRLTLAALISTQTSPKSGKSMDFNQVIKFAN